MIGPSSPGAPPPSGSTPLTRSRPRPPARRILWVSLGVSAVLHLGILFFYPALVRRIDPPRPVPSDGPVARTGMEVLTLREVPDEEAPAEPPLPEVERPDPPLDPPTARDQPGEERMEEVPARRLSAAERLRPREGDPRIWAPLDPAYTELTDTERAALELAGRLQQWNDSVLAVRESEARARDWSFTDSEGRRWGVSSEGVHLGGVTIPMGSEFGSPQQRDEARRRQSEWTEIERGAVDALRRETLEERARAMRERRDRERADTTEGGG